METKWQNFTKFYENRLMPYAAIACMGGAVVGLVAYNYLEAEGLTQAIANAALVAATAIVAIGGAVFVGAALVPLARFSVALLWVVGVLLAAVLAIVLVVGGFYWAVTGLLSLSVSTLLVLIIVLLIFKR